MKTWLSRGALTIFTVCGTTLFAQHRGPGVWACTSATAGAGTLRVTFYHTRPALVVLQRGTEVRVAFQTKAASGTRYEGDDVLFWEARGEATLNWNGVESLCKPPTAGR